MIDWRQVWARFKLRLTHPAVAYHEGIVATLVEEHQGKDLMQAAHDADERNPYK